MNDSREKLFFCLSVLGKLELKTVISLQGRLDRVKDDTGDAALREYGREIKWPAVRLLSAYESWAKFDPNPTQMSLVGNQSMCRRNRVDSKCSQIKSH